MTYYAYSVLGTSPRSRTRWAARATTTAGPPTRNAAGLQHVLLRLRHRGQQDIRRRQAPGTATTIDYRLALAELPLGQDRRAGRATIYYCYDSHGHRVGAASRTSWSNPTSFSLRRLEHADGCHGRPQQHDLLRLRRPRQPEQGGRRAGAGELLRLRRLRPAGLGDQRPVRQPPLHLRRRRQPDLGQRTSWAPVSTTATTPPETSSWPIDAAGVASYFTYNVRGQQTSAMDPLGRTSYFQLRCRGPAHSVHRSRPAQTTYYLYDAAGQRVASIDPLGNPTYFYYDLAGRQKGTIDALGGETYYVYDEQGNRAGRRGRPLAGDLLLLRPARPAEGHHRRLSATRPTTSTTRTATPLARVDALCHASYFVYDALGRQVESFR